MFYYWNEFLQTFSERIAYLGGSIRRARKHGLGGTRLKQRLESLNRDYRPLVGAFSRMCSPNFNPVRSDEILSDFRDHAARAFEFHSALNMVAWDDQVGLWRLLRHPGGLVGYARATKAAARLLDECVDTTFSPASSRFLVRPMIQVGLSEEYAFIPSLSSVSIPTTDLIELHMWPALAHEVFHAKLDQVNQNLHLLRDAGSRRNARVALKTLVNNYDEQEFNRAIDQTIDRPARRLQSKTGDCFSRLYKRFYHSKAYPPTNYYQVQMVEVLCDLASLRICGPADLFRSLVEWADYCRNIAFDFKNHASSATHPLHAIRVLYMIKYFEDYLGYSKLDDPILNGYASQYASFVEYCQSRVSKLLERNASKIFVAYRDELLRDSTLNGLDKLVQRMMWKPLGLDPTKWKTLVDCYGRARSLPRQMTPLEIINLAWIIRADAYSDVSEHFSLGGYDSALRRKRILVRRLFERLASSQST